ncbi:putative PEP-CTERM system TPR-repeat lipoprotein [Desulfuromusa kysingii]|uniref:Putative PEP-CTERM system TPR-repeat lipoprotein n=1 Tax=Desulfuromusa kysingii TaxID=37625 RepID=A0A1H4B8J9_9BACT|nr:XrtA/PEP-CTERM system TPR-repeat protein PrsT [Desulfuromusa kysingii]SEA44471.1 putative PEP-CTERM system TPR-repeat lipoprotein [Desulfuromusa kysingii]
MQRLLILIILLFIVSCGGQSKEELLLEGNRLSAEGNFRGAVVLYKNALEKDVNYLDARIGLAEAYLSSENFDRAEKEFQKVLLQNPSQTDLLLKLAAIYINQKLPEKALLELDKYHSNNHETVESLVLYGRAHGASGDIDSAEQFFKKALQLDSTAIDPRLNLAKVYLQKKDFVIAKQYLQEAISIDNKLIEAYYLLASIETRQGNREAALTAYSNIIQVDAKQLQAIYMSGILQMDLGDMAAAQASIDKLLSSFPDRSDGSRLNGFLLYRQEKYEEAKIALEDSLKKQQHLLSYFFLGLSYYGLENYEIALNQFQKALDLNPSFERARILVSMTLLKQKRLDDAIIEVQKVLRTNPDNAYAHNILGSAYLADGQYDQGMAELETATDLDPDLADAHLKRGIFHLAKGQGAEGEADLVKAVDAAPEVLNGRLMLVTHYLRQKNYSAAVQSLQDGMDGSKADALLNNYLAAAYFSQKKPVQALAALEKAKQANPDYLTPYFNLASYYASQSNYEKAIAEYYQVISADSKNLRALLGIAALYNVQGKVSDVDKMYGQIEATGTESGFVAAAQYQLKKKQTAEALAIVDRGLQSFRDSMPLLELKGGLHLQQQQWDDAETAYIELSGVSAERGNNLLVRLYLSSGQSAKADKLISEVLSSDGDQEYPYLLSSLFLAGQEKKQEAVKILQQGIATVPHPLRLQMQLARTFEQDDKSQLAEQLYQRIIQSAPRFAPAYSALGFLKESHGDKGAALEYYKSAIKFDNKSTSALNNLAYLLMDNFGEEEEALNYAMDAYRLQPNDPRIMDTLGYALIKNGRAEDASNLLEKAHDLLPGVAAVTLHLAMAKIETGEDSIAKGLLEEVIASGDKSELQQAEELLNTL